MKVPGGRYSHRDFAAPSDHRANLDHARMGWRPAVELCCRAGSAHDAHPTYGFMNRMLNTDRKRLSAAPATAFDHEGNGLNAIYCETNRTSSWSCAGWT